MTDLSNPVTEAPAKRKRGRPRRDWTVRSVLIEGLVDSFLENFQRKSERDMMIIMRRLGMGRPRETLEGIGNDYGLTREAMRQIVKRFAKEVLVDERGVDMFLDACASATADGPVPVTSLATMPIFDGIDENPDILAPSILLVDAMAPGRALPHVRDIDGVATLVPIAADAWEHAVSDAARILRLAMPESSGSRADAALSHIPDGTKEAVVRAAAPSVGIYKHGDIHACVRLFLDDSPGPVTLKEIAERVSEVTGSEVRLHRVVNVANRVGVRIARGLYTSQSRVDVSPSEVDAIRHAVLLKMRQGDQDRQWHASELLVDVAGRNGIRSALTPDLLAYALRDSKEIASLGRSIFALAESSHADTRSHLRDLVISILERVGRPMTKRELREEVSRVRGIGPAFNIIEGRGIVRVVGGAYATPEIAEAYHAATAAQQKAA